MEELDSLPRRPESVSLFLGNVGSPRRVPRAPYRAGTVAGVGLLVLALVVSFAAPVAASAPSEAGPAVLDPLSIPKFVNQLTGPPPVYTPTVVTDGADGVVSHDYRVTMSAFMEPMLPPPFPETPVWGYGGPAQDAVTGEPLGFVRGAPGPSFEAERGVPINVEWANEIDTAHMFAVDPTIHWADPNGLGMLEPPFAPYPPGYPGAQAPVPLVPHLHGGEVQSTYDGNPEAWFTSDGIHGSAYGTYRPTTPNATVDHYPNEQPATTLWYHDHALGITRLNVMSGLAGFYLLRDPADPWASRLPSGKYDMPLVIQDRTFLADGTLYFPAEGVNPDVHPYWMPEFFGNTIVVNGKVWPNLNVDRGVYRFRLLDGSNARFYTLSFSNRMPFTVIGTDGGYVRAPAAVTKLTIAPGERYDILVDFSGLAAGAQLILHNTAKAPFPGGAPPQGASTGVLMAFTVTPDAGFAPQALPALLNPDLATFPSLPTPTATRVLTLFEVSGEEGPLQVLLNGQLWDAPVSEEPVAGTTEEWAIVDLTEDAHPIHLHLVQFQLVSRQRLRSDAYLEDWLALNGEPPYDHTPTELSPAAYLRGKASGPSAVEQGWKDTVQVFPGEVTVIRVRFAPIDGSGAYPFDPTSGPGYVWHCHILDHEDNEMMRPYWVLAAVPQTKP